MWPIHFLAARTGSLFPVVLGLVVLVLTGALGALCAVAARRFGSSRLVPVLVSADDFDYRGFDADDRGVPPEARDGARDGGGPLNRWPAFLTVGLLGGLLAIGIFSFAQWELHPANLAAFDRREHVSLRRDTRDGRGIAQNGVTLSFPAAVRIDDDFTVEVDGSLQRVRDSALVGDDGLTLQAGGEGAEITPGSTHTRAGGSLEFKRVWQVTPKKEGDRLFTFGYAGDDLTPALLADTGFIDQTVVWAGAHTATLAPPRLAARVGPRLEVELAQSHAGAPSEVRFPIQVLTTYGVSSRAFSLAKLVSGVVGFFGSIGFFKWLFGRRGKED